MSRKTKRKALQHIPDISLQGTDLDRILSGVVTADVAAQARKDRFLNETHFEPVGNTYAGVTPFKPKTLDPLIVVMVNNSCERCLTTQVSFGYFARKEIKEVGNGAQVVTYKFVEKPLDNPTGMKLEHRSVPYCHACLPNGLYRE